LGVLGVLAEMLQVGLELGVCWWWDGWVGGCWEAGCCKGGWDRGLGCWGVCKGLLGGRGVVWYGMVWYGMVGVLGEFKVQEVKKSGRCVLEGEIDYKSWPWKKLWASCLL